MKVSCLRLENSAVGERNGAFGRDGCHLSGGGHPEGMEPIAVMQGELESQKQGRRAKVKTKIPKHPEQIHREKMYHS